MFITATLGSEAAIESVTMVTYTLASLASSSTASGVSTRSRAKRARSSPTLRMGLGCVDGERSVPNVSLQKTAHANSQLC